MVLVCETAIQAGINAVNFSCPIWVNRVMSNVMSDYTIFHNPHCSKSRATLGLLQDNRIDPAIRLYLESPPTEDELVAIVAALGISPRDLLRRGEDEYKELGLNNPALSDLDLISAMAENPRLIERPIVISPDGKSAVLGRPPENVLGFINDFQSCNE